MALYGQVTAPPSVTTLRNFFFHVGDNTRRVCVGVNEAMSNREVQTHLVLVLNKAYRETTRRG